MIAVTDSPKPPPERVSLTPLALQRCRNMIILVAGQGKRSALNDWRNGGMPPVAAVADGANNAQVLYEAELLQKP